MDEQTKKAIAGLRQSAADLGYPLHHLSDEEIHEGAKRLCATIAGMGFSAEASGAAFAAFGQAFESLEEDVKRALREPTHG